jgi:transcriptional regulator with XRE-family HTH domain
MLSPETIRAKRLELGMTHLEVAKLAGYTTGVITSLAEDRPTVCNYTPQRIHRSRVLVSGIIMDLCEKHNVPLEIEDVSCITGETFRKARKKVGLSQVALAKQINASPVNVASAETGKTYGRVGEEVLAAVRRRMASTLNLTNNSIPQATSATSEILQKCRCSIAKTEQEIDQINLVIHNFGNVKASSLTPEQISALNDLARLQNQLSELREQEALLMAQEKPASNVIQDAVDFLQDFRQELINTHEEVLAKTDKVLDPLLMLMKNGKAI